MLRTEGFEHFEATPRALPTSYQVMAQERVAALRARGAARAALTDDSASVLLLARLTRRCQLLRRQLRERRDAQLAE
eukprot:9485409-Pyramimonas_sp.AAC.1